MVNCPRCQQPVDDMARATCPVCFAPLPAPRITPTTTAAPSEASLSIPTVPPLPGAGAQLPMRPTPGARPWPMEGPTPPVSVPAQYSPPVPAPGFSLNAPAAPGQPARRTTLTGEVIETAGSGATTGYGTEAHPTPRATYGPAPSPGGLPALPDYIARAAMPSNASQTPYRPASGYRASTGWSSYLKMRLAVAAVGLTIAAFAYAARLVAGTAAATGAPAGASPFAGLQLTEADNPEAASLRTPEGAAQTVMQALHNRDWRKVYYACAFEANERKTNSEAEEFERELGRSASLNTNPLTVFNLMAAATTYVTSSATEHGNTADVATSWTIPYEGETLSLRGTAHLIRQGNAWLLNLANLSATLDDLLGQVANRTGHGRTITIPHFGGFGPHSFPAPPVVTRPPFSPRFPRYPGGNTGQQDTASGQTGGQTGSQPAGAPPGFTPDPRFGPGPRMPSGPGFMPGPRLDPNGFSRGPRFGPQSFPGNGTGPSQGGGFGNRFGRPGPMTGTGGFGGSSSGPGGMPPSGSSVPPDAPPP